VNLTLFDLDNTLLNGDSDFEWSQFLIRIGVLDRELFEAKNLDFYEHYKAGTLDIQEFLDFQLKPLSRHARKTLDEWHRRFMREQALGMISEAARDLVNLHRKAGDVCAIITATNSFVTAPIAREFGVEHLIATEPEQKNGEFTGRVAGVPSFREGKITRLEEWMKLQGWDWGSFAETTFYSDSLNDLPLLAKVKHPVAVNPDETLLKHAELHGWKVMSLR
jgi:HAD superfamily hydrolase (TIGR01490 family)